MTLDISADAFLMGGGIPSAQFPVIDTEVGGRIVGQPEVTQQTDLDTGEPKFWPDGKPMMQLVVTVQTDLRDPEIVDDDGMRKFYIKGKMLEAVRAGVRAAGAKGLAPDGDLRVKYIADGEVKKRGHNPPKIYTSRYKPPAAVQANAFLNGGQPAQAAPQAPAQGFVPANQGAAPQWAAQPTPAQAQPAQAAPAAEGAVWTPPPGMDPQQAAALASLPPAQRAALGYP